MERQSTVGVIGGGISGIAAAYYLSEMGYSVEIIEAEGDIGGRVGCDYIGERRIEFGGKNIGRNYPRFREFVSNIGDYEYEFFGINTSSKIAGKQRTIDSEKPIKTLLNVVAMTGVKDFIKMSRMLSAIRRNPDNGYLRGPYFSQLASAKDAEPITEHFGNKYCQNFIRPLTIRMNGCEPQDYYLGNFGSNLKMILDKYDQLVDGVYDVISTFSQRVSIRTATRVTGLVYQAGRVHGVNAEHNGQSINLNYDAVVMATPAPVTAGIVKESLPSLAAILRRIRYNPVGIAVAKYSRPIFTPAVRAQVFGTEHALSNAGAYGINDLDIVRYTFSGTTSNQQISERSDPADVVTLGEKTLNSHLPVTAAEREGFVYRYFKNGLCAYAPHHADLVNDAFSIIGGLGGLAITGDYMRGAAIEACFYAASEAAAAIREQLVVDVEVKGAV